MDALGLYDIYDYWYTPIWQTGGFKVLMSIFGLGALVGMLFLIVKKWGFRRHTNVWDVWHRNLNGIRKEQVSYKKFYETVTQTLKEVAVMQLNAPAGSTDAELTIFFKSELFPAEVRIVGDVIHRGTLYKFDPACSESILKEKELEHVIEAVTVIQKMVYAKQ